MTFLDDCPMGRSQLLTQSRAKSPISWTSLARYVRSPAIPAKLPKPDFLIGEKVSDHWVDEFGKNCVEFGEVMGICWHPRQETWAYLIDWYKGQGPDSLYPCFDRHLVIGGDLRRSND
ncbi:MAG: hypothetical protein JGK17_31865 [Microcoleus sp. PH2017_10_PVI_O_A]|uniref:hypothetical protein n=1 Tax=unclassified Microcoleus TaxID=2642155 RepID=UPI001D8D2A20|nr:MULTISPECIES: hypothetical protein [unclassified Microcoleus]TAE86189.1 MAG: hypothetical protein EAZ83_00545 [Oscillatoriales cyanobacterium]MCC3410051.1 hypothetical protein [Microcoleus sp. PH2017_10_PVI_O_A]MCC3463791.1 hypothetical protein [Microcoleus sp. PH2017_11_PCY_U_A]MCC3482675.1 hypothetical protein [Microcoleus sp. PH2017_12_PCY_D_A]MCC3563639.1 hypothetical protein [Microcoleus sp. PH2017_27_LUM_O_A]